MHQFSFSSVNNIICEPGVSKQLGQHCKDLNVSRVMFVTDPGIIKTGMSVSIIKAIEASGVSVLLYSDVQADPPEDLVLSTVELARN